MAKDPVDLLDVGSAFPTVLQPHKVAWVHAGDLTDGPIDVSPERQDRT